MVGNLQQLLREATLEAVGRVMGAKDRPAKRRQGSGQRKPEQLAELTEQLYEGICAQPGETMRTIAKAIGRRSDELALSAHRLIAQRRVKKAGQRDQTRYFPVDAPTKRSRRAKR